MSVERVQQHQQQQQQQLIEINAALLCAPKWKKTGKWWLLFRASNTTQCLHLIDAVRFSFFFSLHSLIFAAVVGVVGFVVVIVGVSMLLQLSSTTTIITSASCFYVIWFLFFSFLFTLPSFHSINLNEQISLHLSSVSSLKCWSQWLVEKKRWIFCIFLLHKLIAWFFFTVCMILVIFVVVFAFIPSFTGNFFSMLVLYSSNVSEFCMCMYVVRCSLKTMNLNNISVGANFIEYLFSELRWAFWIHKRADSMFGVRGSVSLLPKWLSHFFLVYPFQPHSHSSHIKVNNLHNDKQYNWAMGFECLLSLFAWVFSLNHLHETSCRTMYSANGIQCDKFLNLCIQRPHIS